MFDLPSYVFKVKPEDQEDYYNGRPFGKKARESAGKSEPAAAPTAAKVDNDW